MFLWMFLLDPFLNTRVWEWDEPTSSYDGVVTRPTPDSPPPPLHVSMTLIHVCPLQSFALFGHSHLARDVL